MLSFSGKGSGENRRAKWSVVRILFCGTFEAYKKGRKVWGISRPFWALDDRPIEVWVLSISTGTRHFRSQKVCWQYWGQLGYWLRCNKLKFLQSWDNVLKAHWLKSGKKLVILRLMPVPRDVVGVANWGYERDMISEYITGCSRDLIDRSK